MRTFRKNIHINGDRYTSVRATVSECFSLAYHRTVDRGVAKNPDFAWTLTHKSSGFALAVGKSWQACRKAMELMLAADIDWSMLDSQYLSEDERRRAKAFVEELVEDGVLSAMPEDVGFKVG